MSFFKRLFGSSEEAELKRLNKIVAQVNALEPAMQKKNDAQLRDVTADLKSRVAGGETLDEVLPEAFAAVREAMVRTLGKRHFDVQILGGIVLHQGRIAQMRTGEGKTYTAALAAYLNTLNGNSVHIVTVNDYLAKFQGEEMGKVYRFLGLTVGIVLHSDDPREHAAQYACDIVYGTNNEFGFDYLRDNMAVRKDARVQRSLDFAIVDEVDSILIDEARTPLIISGPGDESTDLYQAADRFVRTLRSDDYEVDEKKKTVILLESGVAKAERYFNVENLSDMENTTLNHHINQALKAHTLMHLDTDYVIKDGEIIIVDEFTGRLMVGRRYSDGLHQAIEAKEGVSVRNESRTLATITFQNYFRMYKKLSGMTGTAKTEEEEFRGIYALDVVCIPTNKPMIRKDLPDRIFLNSEGKFRHVVEEIERVHKTGQPVLVGTVSVEKSEMLSKMLGRKGVPHVVLNAKMHEKEAEIVAQAGKIGAVTIATNMAGRGTDILLGGNPEFLARKQMRADGYDEELIDQAQSFSEGLSQEAKEAREVYRGYIRQFSVQTDQEHDQVVALGGLYIIGTERHEARRIDDQLRGRAGRQGDPGMSVFYISLQDDLLRLFGSDRIAPMIEKMGLGPDDMIDAKMLSKQIENAQKRVESRNYDIRRHVLQYDDVMNQQREIIYAQRRQVLEGESVRTDILKMLDDLVVSAVDTYCPKDQLPELWDFDGLNAYLGRFFLPEHHFDYTEKELIGLSRDDLISELCVMGKEAYAAREQDAAAAGVDMRQVERIILLRVVDDKWMNHIDNMDQLRRGIGLRAVGQRDPVREYQFEGYDMFEEMVQSIRETTVQMLLHVSFQRRIEPEAPKRVTLNTNRGEDAPRTPVRAAASKKIGRNDPCPCGSGKKYKNCCGKNL